ncbi:hypothetical protein Pint_05359 [Pistacia integerrima]|uniref:Uncharacterized protein n=1 Tax=Pistacia integerrima TaxID=434235 RepID=A0ACC0Z8P9_9ROSI|nr:hypothetical protein Pint_05359 [Pistacia integerrima]
MHARLSSQLKLSQKSIESIQGFQIRVPNLFPYTGLYLY